MAVETIKAWRVGAEQLKGLVARWRNQAESRDQDGRQNRTGRVEHLRKVADAFEKREKEIKADKPVTVLPVEAPPADEDKYAAMLGPSPRP
jgi:hypothetical protein